MHIRIQDADGLSLHGQAISEIHRHEALAHAAFTAHYHDPVLDLTQVFAYL